MNNFYTLIYLIQEWKRRLIGTYFAEALSFRKSTLTLFFQGIRTSDATTNDVLNAHQVTFCADPQRTAIFIDRFSTPKRSNAAAFFETLEGLKLIDIRLAEADRYVQFIFEGGEELVFLLYGNKANALLVRDGIIAEAFKREASLTGERVPEPASASPKSSTDTDVTRTIFALQPLLPRPVVRHWVALQTDELNALDAANRLDNMLRASAHPHIDEDYGFAILHPTELKSEEAQVFDSVNDGVARQFYANVRAQEFTSRKRELTIRLQRVEDKLSKSLTELERLPESLKKANYLEENGHLLMANPHQSAQNGVLSVEDFYNDGLVRKIKIDENRSLIQNANHFYQKAKSTRLYYESSLKRITLLEQKRERLLALMVSLDALDYKREFDKWIKSHEDDLRAYGISGRSDQQVAVPYRSLFVQGYEIKIGKSATANDDLIRISHKEDIWLHARGVSGSHVIIVMTRNLGMPPKPVIEIAAQYAAFYSKAKGSSLHPVIFTKRKYVRKPKGSAPGAVRVEREDVVLVVPAEPDFSNSH